MLSALAAVRLAIRTPLLMRGLAGG
jgi:hypothetical protein